MDRAYDARATSQRIDCRIDDGIGEAGRSGRPAHTSEGCPDLGRRIGFLWGDEQLALTQATSKRYTARIDRNRNRHH